MQAERNERKLPGARHGRESFPVAAECVKIRGVKPQSQPRPLCAPSAFLLAWRLLRLRFHDKAGDFLAGLVVRLLSPSVVRAPLLAALALAGAALLSIPAGEARADSGHGRYALHCAAGYFGEVGKVNHLLGSAHGVDVDEQDSGSYGCGRGSPARAGNSYSPLYWAVKYDRAHIIPVLISAGANVNAKDGNDSTPIHTAIGRNHAVIVAALISARADLNVKNKDGHAALHHAANNANGESHASVIATLIEAGAHWGEACASPGFVNPAGPTPPCLCESPNVETNLGACEPVAVCAAPSVLNAGANRCDCPAPNVGEDGADAPGVCAVPSMAACAGLDPPEYYAATLSACVPFADCQAGATLNRVANQCECAGAAVLDGAGTGCLCESPNVGTPGDCAVPSAQVCEASGKEFTGMECECPAGRPFALPNGECVKPSVSACGSLFYDSVADACVPFVSCSKTVGGTPRQGPAYLNRDKNECECSMHDFRHLRGNACYRSCASDEVAIVKGGSYSNRHYECIVPSVESCGGLDPAKFYTGSTCVSFNPCAGGTLDRKTNTCGCAPPAALDDTGRRCECLAPNLYFGVGDCRAPSAANCAEHGVVVPAFGPPRFFDSTRVSITAGECTDELFPCHDSAIRKADNSGCECPAGAFAHKPHSGGRWSFVRSEWRKYGTAECHADHAPIQHTLQPGDWLAAVRANNPAIVAHFISGHKWDPDAGDALHAAAAGGHHQAAKVLIEGGADIHRKRNGAMPLHAAVENGRGPLITLLLQRGANPDIADGDGDTALHLAARRTDTAENAELISFLLDKGANPNPRNRDGWRPLDLAYNGGDARTWQARGGIMAALIAGGADWSAACRGGAIPNALYEGAAAVATYPRCACPLHISQRDSFGACECPAHSHAQVNGRCLPKDSAQVAAEIADMRKDLLDLRAALVSLNARLAEAADMPREMVEEIAEQAGDTAQEIKRRRDNFLALARADLAGDPAPPVATSDTEAECRMLGGDVEIDSATGIRICSGIDANDTFCLVNSSGAFPCRGLFRHVRRCNDGHNRPALNPFFCGPECGNQSARGAKCGVPAL